MEKRDCEYRFLLSIADEPVFSTITLFFGTISAANFFGAENHVHDEDWHR